MRRSISTLLLLLATASAGAAQQDTRSVTTAFSRARGYDPLLTWATVWGDTERQGVYTCEEWKRYAGKLFDQADRGHRGFIDAREFEAIRKADPMLKDADLGYFDDNRDGRVSRKEFVDKPNPFFARYDKKRTCRVTVDDIGNEAAEAEKSGRTKAR